MGIRAFAPAKVNLTLHVTGQRGDGYHLLDSLVVFADVGDWLTIELSDKLSLDVSGPFANGVPTDHRNLAWQAANLFDQPVAIHLEKNLPHGAGIGGGSSDAAATLNALSDMTGQSAPDATLLGADVPVCMRRRATRMGGIGEVLHDISHLPPLWAVLVNPGAQIPTPSVFSALAQKSNPPMIDPLPRFQTARQWMLWLADQRNDLEAPAITQAPVVEDVLKTLSEQSGVFLTRMSGSGATCFGLFDDQGLAEIAARQIGAAHTNWWVRDCCLNGDML